MDDIVEGILNKNKRIIAQSNSMIDVKDGAVNLRMNLLLVMVIGKQIQPIPYMI